MAPDLYPVARCATILAMAQKKKKQPMTKRVTVRVIESDYDTIQQAAELVGAKLGTTPSTAIRQALMRWAKGTIGAHGAL